MSKTSFRPRQVDYTKYMPIYLNDELPDLQDFSSINRTVPQMPTGMEKEEESEHHLQRALSAQQVFGISSTEYAIPTPKVEIDNKKYDKIYNAECPKSKSYIRIQRNFLIFVDSYRFQKFYFLKLFPPILNTPTTIVIQKTRNGWRTRGVKRIFI